MRAWIAGLIAIVLAGCKSPDDAQNPVTRGPDVDIDVMAMQSRPLRVISYPAPVVRPTAVADKPKRKRRRTKPKPVPAQVIELPPDESFRPEPPQDEPPIDIPVDSPDVAADLAKEFKRRDEERRRRKENEGE